MPPNRDGDGSKRDATPGGESGSDGNATERPGGPADTGNLLVTAAVDSDDADVLRAMLAHVDQGRIDVHAVLCQLGADFFCEENGWRKLFARLLDAPAEAAAFKRRALSDYLQRLEAAREAGATGAGVGAAAHTSEQVHRRDDYGPALAPLERGQPTTLRFEGLNRIECRLGSCVLWITPGSPPQLAITGQRSLPLQVGHTRIGRALDNDVVLGERWPDVSRRHLQIEVTATRDVVLTDTSSHGTLVTAAAIGR